MPTSVAADLILIAARKPSRLSPYTARSRWALLIPRDEEGNIGDEDLRVLSRRKANCARMGEEIELRWTDGVLMPTNPKAQTAFSGVNRLLGAGAKFLELLDRCLAQNVFVSNSRNAGNYAPRVFSKRPDRSGYTRGDFEAAMQDLFAAKRLINVPYGRPGDARFRIGAADAEEPADQAPEPDPEIQEWREACAAATAGSETDARRWPNGRDPDEHGEGAAA